MGGECAGPIMGTCAGTISPRAAAWVRCAAQGDSSPRGGILKWPEAQFIVVDCVIAFVCSWGRTADAWKDTEKKVVLHGLPGKTVAPPQAAVNQQGG